MFPIESHRHFIPLQSRWFMTINIGKVDETVDRYWKSATASCPFATPLSKRPHNMQPPAGGKRKSITTPPDA